MKASRVTICLILICVLLIALLGSVPDRSNFTYLNKFKKVALGKTAFRISKEAAQKSNKTAVSRIKKKCKSSVSEFVFIKTHKTASSMMRNLLENYHQRHGFKSIATKNLIGPFIGGYPGRFRCVFKYPRNATYSTWHIRFNAEEMQQCFPPDTKYITIIRDPWTEFQSAFDYYAKKFQNNPYCFGMPQAYVLQGQNMGVNKFLLEAAKLLDNSVPWYFRFRNYQSHDLGLDPMLTDKEEFEKQIQKLDNDLDLVLINEYMEESMVLLKDTMCMNWTDVRIKPTKQKHITGFKPMKTEMHQKAFLKLNSMDLALYEHFNRTLWKRVEAYGRKRFAEDLEKLRAQSHKFKREIPDAEDEKGESDWSKYEPKSKEWMNALRKYMISNAGDCYIPT